MMYEGKYVSALKCIYNILEQRKQKGVWSVHSLYLSQLPPQRDHWILDQMSLFSFTFCDLQKVRAIFFRLHKSLAGFFHYHLSDNAWLHDKSL